MLLIMDVGVWSDVEVVVVGDVLVAWAYARPMAA